ncbi:uncharacterized protein PRCAT00000202001 [Priceomyces carsonii]|uniref:uncharacterized protein n=1 Tax=Priceomyces carsonii TaxID=28549 RepID=UPI002EDA4719|nr:unnamed protein product [Priceomyces carsonii]
MSRALSSTRVLIGDEIIPATLIFSIESGKILQIERKVLQKSDPLLRLYNVLPKDYRNVTPLVIMPGIVDAHVHLNEPGRTEWEGFATGTQAAASGGVTTVIDMPLNAIPPTTTVANFNLKICAAKGQTWVDVGFWGGLVPDNLESLKPLISMGVRGFKGFLIDSGVEEFPAIDGNYILQAMKEVENLSTLLMFHAEMQPNMNEGPALTVKESANTSPKLVVNEKRANFSLADEDEDSSTRTLKDESSSQTTKDRSLASVARDSLSTAKTHTDDKLKALSTDLDEFSLGMSASFINRAPKPVVDLLNSSKCGHDDEHEHCRLPHNHAGSIDHNVLSDEQAKALAKSPILAASEPRFGKYARIAHRKYDLSPFVEAMREDQLYKDDSSFDTPLLLAQQEDSTLANVDATSYATFLASRPDNFETTAIAEIIHCSTKIPTVPLHIVHLATHEAIPLIRAAKSRNLPITAETCFHYLSLSAEKISSCSTHFKCCPPIRTDDNRKLLWRALRNNIITTVVSDHSPCTPELKGLDKGDFFSAWGGISSVGFGLPILYTEGTKLDPPVTLQEISKWCSLNTAKQVGLEHRKGKIDVGYDADLLLFNPDVNYVVQNYKTFFKNKLTAYDGMEFKGRVMETIVRGNSVFALGKGHSDIPLGTLLLEPRT